MFITVEGGEGVGKSTQVRLLVEALAARGMDALATREPGGSAGAEAVRRLVLSPEPGFSPLAQTLLHFAARADHVEMVIRPALAAGRWVVCDRFYDSTMAYQGYGLGMDRGVIASLIGMVGIVPDVTVVLEVSPAVARARVAARDGGVEDRYQRLDAAFHARVAAGFREIARAETGRCVVVDAGGRPDAVARVVLAAVMAG